MRAPCSSCSGSADPTRRIQIDARYCSLGRLLPKLDTWLLSSAYPFVNEQRHCPPTTGRFNNFESAPTPPPLIAWLYPICSTILQARWERAPERQYRIKGWVRVGTAVAMSKWIRSSGSHSAPSMCPAANSPAERTSTKTAPADSISAADLPADRPKREQEAPTIFANQLMRSISSVSSKVTQQVRHRLLAKQPHPGGRSARPVAAGPSTDRCELAQAQGWMWRIRFRH